MDIVTKTNRNEYLSTKDKYYIAGWVDGEQDATPQCGQTFNANASTMFDKPEELYLEGYADAKDNEYAMGGQ
jgi:hypothetical protein